MKKIKERGITLIALVITIVVLLILAGITIGAITGDNGIINKTGQAKEDAEIANEKEIIDTSTVEAMGKNKRGNLVEDEFQSAIDKHTDGKAQVTDIGEEFEVYFTETNRYYMVDKDGNIGDYEIGVTDKYPGDITKDENGNNLEGTEDSPFQINCIEDLVSLSNMVNRMGKVLQDGQLIDGKDAKLITKDTYIVLTRDLNFKSRASYVDSERTDFGDINGDDADGNVLMEELVTKMGFRPIGLRNNNTDYFFLGNFNANYEGENHKISNLYINYENDTLIDATYDMAREIGLFGRGENNSTVISNLEVTGEVKGYGHTGGIIGAYAKRINNCINRVNIKGRNMAGGIIGNGEQVVIDNCSNYGKIEVTKVIFSSGGAGGISGCAKEINNCKNYGTIIADNDSGTAFGGYGGVSGTGGKIDFCKNYGKIEVINRSIRKSCGGIVGGLSGTSVTNCENYGEIIGYGYTGGIIGELKTGNWSGEYNIVIENCTNKGKIEDETDSTGGIVGGMGYIYKSYKASFKNCYNTATLNIGIIGIISIYYDTQINDFEFINVYDCNDVHLKIENEYSYKGEISKKTIEEMKTQQFTDLLNGYKDESGNYPSEWKRWKLGEDGYSTFE